MLRVLIGKRVQLLIVFKLPILGAALYYQQCETKIFP